MGSRMYQGSMSPTLKKYLEDYHNSRQLHNRLQFARSGKGIKNTGTTHFAAEQIATALRTEAATDHVAGLLQSLQNKYKVNTKSPEMMQLLDLLYKDGSTKGVKGESKDRDITTLANEIARAFNIPPGKEMDALRKRLTEYKAMIKVQKEIAKAMKDTKQISIRNGKIVMYDKDSTSNHFGRLFRRWLARPKVEIPKF